MTAWYDKDTNSVHVDKARDYLGILLHFKMFNLDKDVNVYVGDEKISSIKPKDVAGIATETWNLLHDKDMIITAMIYLEYVEGKWTVKNAESLHDAKLKPISSKL